MSRITLNSFLISLILNLGLLLGLALYKEHPIPRSKEKVKVDFVSLPSVRLLQRRAVNVQTAQTAFSDSSQEQSAGRLLTVTRYTSIIREVTMSPQNLKIIAPAGEIDLSKLPSVRLRNSYTGASNASDPSGSNAYSSGRKNLSGSRTGQAGGRIQPHESKAMIAGSGKSLSGYYNMSLVRYEDSSDNISTSVLAQLAGAMNRWTQIRTKVIKEPMRLDASELQRVPLIYITSQRPFAFSERERENLRRYFAGGGFMIFSNVASSEAGFREVANSIGFELWKILGEAAHDLVDIEKSHLIYNSFFDLRKTRLPNLLGITLNGRIIVVYEDSGYGAAWGSGRDSDREPYPQMGVNIIAYALTTNPSLIHAQ